MAAMHKNLKWKFVLVILVIATSFWLFYPASEKINLGLDLQGGMHLVLRVDASQLPPKARSDATQRAIEIIRNRIDQFGVSEPSIQRQGADKIVIQLPGVTDRERALRVIGRTALLEFKLVANQVLTEKTIRKIDKVAPIKQYINYVSFTTGEGFTYKNMRIMESDVEKVKQILEKEEVRSLLPEGYHFLLGRPEEQDSLKFRELYLLKKEPEIKGIWLTDARIDFSQFYQYRVLLNFNRQGQRKLSRVTGRAAQLYQEQGIISQLAIVLDDVVYSAPLMKVKIDANPVIEGRFTKEEASDLAIVLRAGALPAPIQIEEERTVGPTLGRDSVEKGVRAIIFGGILVVVFMSIYYLIAGLVADFALCTNILIILGALAYFKATLTLPGIAGLILTIGMAVDANVLIFERMREEFRRGKPLRLGIATGYSKAFSTILDANLTTLITALILFKVGTGPIRGFAITLTIGILASMFTALVVTRLIFDMLSLNKRFNKLFFLQFFKETKIDFLKRRYIAYFLSAIVIIVGLSSFIMRGAGNFGVDFTGGTLVQVRFEKKIELDEIRSIIKKAGIESAQLQKFGEKNEILIKSDADISKIIKKDLSQNLKDNKFEILRIEHVGPAVGQELRKKAVLAVIFALVGMLIYISLRFEFIFAVGAIVALFHDAIITIGLLSLSGRQISLPVIAAILTIVGYSINDTIVVFDRIREDARLMQASKKDFKKIVNTALNETLSRTILTSTTTLMVVATLFVMGGAVIKDFAFTLLVGIIVGTYSSIYVASPILIDWHYKTK
jgi:SecD/SecF fusion protein